MLNFRFFGFMQALVPEECGKLESNWGTICLTLVCFIPSSFTLIKKTTFWVAHEFTILGVGICLV
jgi:hypothetical protein